MVVWRAFGLKMIETSSPIKMVTIRSGGNFTKLYGDLPKIASIVIKFLSFLYGAKIIVSWGPKKIGETSKRKCFLPTLFNGIGLNEMNTDYLS